MDGMLRSSIFFVKNAIQPDAFSVVVVVVVLCFELQLIFI